MNRPLHEETDPVRRAARLRASLANAREHALTRMGYDSPTCGRCGGIEPASAAAAQTVLGGAMLDQYRCGCAAEAAERSAALQRRLADLRDRASGRVSLADRIAP